MGEQQAYANLKKHMETASVLYTRLGAACLADPELAGLIRQLRRQVTITDSFMLGAGVAAACAQCARATGSCCFREMGESYGPVQLFVNRLLGVEFPPDWRFPASCYFVGENGCRLKFRHSFCLNYFCPDLLKILGEQSVLAMQQQVGQQLQVGWKLEQALSRYVPSSATPEH